MQLSLLSLLAACAFAGLTTVGSSPDGMVFDFETPQPRFAEVMLDGSTYMSVILPGSDNLAAAGLPSLPVYRAWIEVPAGAATTVTIDGASVIGMDVPGGVPVAPGLPSVPKDQPRDSYDLVFDSGVYLEGATYPSEWVRVIRAGSMRGHDLALVEVTPVRWDPSSRSVDVLQRAQITIGFEGGAMASPSERERLSANAFDAMLAGTLANWGALDSFDGTDSPMGAYLIIAHPDFYETAMDDFVTWKMRSGYPVTLVSTATAGTTPAAIQDYIQNAIENWEDPPQYVLLVGDSNFIPGYTSTTYGGVTDLYYVCLDDGGWIPDAFIGRFSVQTTGQCILMAERLIDYEQWNYPGSGAWLQSTGWISSSDNYSITEGTHNYCIDTYCTPLGYTADKLYPHTYGSSAADVVTAVNQGESMLTFSGHGSQTSWGDMSFGSSSFNQLNNEGMFPGVLSHACLTGDYATGTAWCETWTRTPGRGGLWFWGSVPSSYWTEDDIQQRAEFDYFLGQQIFWSMGFLNGGKLALYAYYSGGGSTRYYFEGYNLMGDPSAEMWTWQPSGGVPMTMNVSHPASISGTQGVTVTVTGATDDALVCLWKGDEIYERGWTSGGSATFYCEPATSGTILVTVRRHNFKPYLGTISVTGVGVGGGDPVHPLTVSCPNPLFGSGVVTITGQGPVSLEVFDLAGRMVSRPFQGEIDGSESVSLGTRDLVPGVYFVRLTGSQGVASQRVTVLR